ncbi:unnamed protein product [Microthlaspi erraticum]|uniref:Peptide chain release factor domain-containing protein n=1 Tax=Microthlaspi erraticum TaxID=1685480 RepID=A0A6D2HM39_9BRAS|nr:unnamed protein product [Microthlaspi erraticum]
MELINDLRAKQKEIDGLKSLVSESSDDKDMLDMAVSELGEAVEEEKRLQTLLLKSLLPKDEADERDCILEVRAGTGGEEASLFAMDICRMYERYSQKKDGVCVQSLEHQAVSGMPNSWRVGILSQHVRMEWFVFGQKKVGGMKLDELPGLDALTLPGTSDGQTKIVREGDNGVAYSWNMREQRWDKVRFRCRMK